jgi:pimeloyl-ACP methyl ester carboxylesterase
MRVMMKKLGAPAIQRTVLEQITVPTTLIWGRLDRAIRVQIAEVASARYGSPRHVIDGAADDAPTEQPEGIAPHPPDPLASQGT